MRHVRRVECDRHEQRGGERQGELAYHPGCPRLAARRARLPPTPPASSRRPGGGRRRARRESGPRPTRWPSRL